MKRKPATRPSLCDVNVLLALAYRRHTGHRAASDWLGQVDSEAAVVICRQTQMGLLRLLSTRAVMGGDALDTPRCWAVFDVMMSDERFVFAREPRDTEAVFRHVMRQGAASPHVWQDAYLAAFAIAAGCQIVTFDQAFRQFAGLEAAILVSPEGAYGPG